MPRSLSLSLTCVLAVALAGCDRQSTEPAQPQEAAAAENGKELHGEVDRSFAGQAMPDATLTDPAGGTLSLASLKGRPALINLWATWCVPCVAEMPLLDELAGELDGSVRVLTVSQDTEDAERVVKAFFAQRSFEHLPQWIDPMSNLSIAFGGGSLPLTVLYDAEGKEVWRVLGGYDWSSAEAREMIAEATAT